MVDGSHYEEMTTAKGTTIVLPSDPIKAGFTFSGWNTVDDGTGTWYREDSKVNEDLTLYAIFAEQVRVKFLVKDDEGHIISEKSQYYIDMTAGSSIETLPDDPFIMGKKFERWENETTGEEVKVGTVVENSFNAVAVFSEIQIYKLTVNYFYMNDTQRVDIGSQTYYINKGEIEAGYTVTAPGSTYADELADPQMYYPSLPTITVYGTESEGWEHGEGTDSDKMVLSVVDEYVPADAQYKVGHYLKSLDGEGYTDLITPAETKNGVKNSKVTPEINNYAFADYVSRDTDVLLTGDPDQELKVYYDRKDFTLSYNVAGGEYIEAVTAPYGTEITLPTTATRAGYTFAGWQNGTEDVSSPYKLEENTTLTAKWNAAQSEYKIIYMTENANDDGYSYLATVTKTAPTDSTVTMTAQSAGAQGTRPSELDTTNFTFRDSTTETVAPDGTTVVTVRYSRNVYTLLSQSN